MGSLTDTHEPNVTRVAALTADGVTLRGVLIACREPADPDVAIVVGHGFTGSIHRPASARVLRRLARRATVVALDFRGHGRSDGGSSVGGIEVLDLAAAVALARQHGYRRVVTLGFSMGASVVLRHAALHEPAAQRPAAVAAVSSPARWWARDTAAIRRVHFLLEAPLGRRIAPLFGARLGEEWGYHPPLSPVEVMHRIAPTPLLLVHGEDDHYFPVEHAVALHGAAGGDARLWLEPGMKHAETGMNPGLVDRIARWLTTPAETPAPTPGII
ncbi:MAG: alpha/beta hydrolase [Sciscionella sp.]